MHDPRGHPEVVAVLDGDHADAVCLRHGDGGGDAEVRGEEAEAVVAVDLGYYGGDLVEGWGGEGVEEVVAEAG